MSSETLLYIILSGILALLVALFQYSYKSKQKTKLSYVFTFLRFLTIFSILLLLINPKFDQVKVYTEKPNLILAIDNSNSIQHLKQDSNTLEFLKSIQSNSELSDKFAIEVFKFDAEITKSDSLQFNAKETDINNALHQLSEIYKNDIAPIVLVSDGNQSFGNDYSVSNKNYNQPIYPIILGDTVTYSDLKIQQLNVNKYAFLKNKFPVEAILVYQGNTTINTNFTIRQGNKTVFSKAIQFSKTKNSTIVNLTLPANRVGVNSYSAKLEPLQSEKNTINNSKNFAVEVIDQKTKIALVSSFPHPDLGTIKKSIESNEQRSVQIIDSYNILNKVNDFQLVIMYQPNNKFKRLYEILKTENKNRFTIIGTKTDLSFLNTTISEFRHDITNQTEDFQPKLNLNFSPFIIDDINFETFPPLKSNFGDVKFNVPFETILEKTVLGASKNQPLLATFEVNSRREGLLLGENIWQWRAQSFLNEKSFNPFDNFMGKLIQYLASNKRKSRLNIDYDSFYTGNTNIVIKAQLFDKSYAFDARQSLELVLTNLDSKEKKIIPFVLKNNNYQVNLNGIEASKYNFTVRAKGENISKSGNFEVLEFNIEQQFLNADVTKLQQLATNTKGKSYFVTKTSNVVTDLINDERYKPIQKSNKNTIPLIDWKYLLGLIVLTLSLEWFLRKYNGLI